MKFYLFRETNVSTKQFIRKMRITFLLIFLITSGLFATPGSSQVAKVSINLKNATVAKVIDAIENQTDYLFVYSKNEIDLTREVSVDAEQQAVAEVLTNLFDKTNIVYAMEGTNIMLMLKSSAQQAGKTISGKVTDQSGVPIPGASVVVKGTTTGVITGGDGSFSLSNIPENAILQFSFVGMKPQEISIENKTNISIVMEELTIGIDEVIAVGYGTQKKVNLSGAVVSMSGDQMTKRPITNPTAMIQGLAPGVRVTQGIGQPGNEQISIRVRGQGTFSGAGSDPLILVNGVPGSMSNLDPNMIENVTVLKDAASASIYGARAANGVVLITTKQGNKSGKATISYSGNFASHSASKLFNLVTNSVEFMQLANIAHTNSGQSGSNYPQETIDLYKNNVGNIQYPNFDWQDYMFNAAFVQSHNISASATTDKVTYNIGLNYVDQNGTLRGFNYKKYNLTLDLTAKITNFIKIGTYINAKYGKTMQTRQSETDALLSTISQAPTYMPWLPDDGTGITKYTWGAYTIEQHNKNMPAIIATGTVKPNDDFDINGQVWMEITLAKGLTWYSKGASRMYQNRVFDWRGAVTPIYMYQGGAEYGGLDKGGVGMNDLMERTFYTNFYSYLQYEYKSANKDHNIKIMAGYNQEDEKYINLGAYRRDYPFVLQTIDAGGTTGWSNSGASTEWALQSYFGRINYDFKNRYLFEANARYDGTSRISSANRWGMFPSFSAAWRLTEESFIKNLDLKWLSNAKIRGSWGQLGNQNIGLYPYQAMISKVSAYPFDKKNESLSYIQTAYANNDIKWETTTITDIGADLTLFHRLGVTFDWYEKTTSDILRGSQVSALVGLSAPTVNRGSMTNKGIELALNWTDAIRGGSMDGFQYNFGFNIDRTRNKLNIFGATEISGNRIYQEGLPYGTYYMLKCIGVFADANEVTSSPKQFTDNTLPGDLKYFDANADGKIDNNDRITMDGVFPAYEYSFVGGANWKGIDLSFMGASVQGKKFYVNGWGVQPFRQGSSPTREYLAGMWTPEKPNGAINPKLYFDDMGGSKNSRTNSWYLNDASYFRLKNLTLGYTIPKTLTDKVKMNKLRVYFSGDNLFLITKYKGLDPERNGDGSGTEYPQNKIVSFGLNVEF